MRWRRCRRADEPIESPGVALLPREEQSRDVPGRGGGAGPSTGPSGIGGELAEVYRGGWRGDEAGGGCKFRTSPGSPAGGGPGLRNRHGIDRFGGVASRIRRPDLRGRGGSPPAGPSFAAFLTPFMPKWRPWFPKTCAQAARAWLRACDSKGRSRANTRPTTPPEILDDHGGAAAERRRRHRRNAGRIAADRTEYYNEFLCRLRLRHVAGAIFARPGRRISHLSRFGPGRGPFDDGEARIVRGPRLDLERAIRLTPADGSAGRARTSLCPRPCGGRHRAPGCERGDALRQPRGVGNFRQS